MEKFTKAKPGGQSAQEKNGDKRLNLNNVEEHNATSENRAADALDEKLLHEVSSQMC